MLFKYFLMNTSHRGVFILLSSELIADDIHDELVVAYANQLSIMPYKCFVEGSSSIITNSTNIFVGLGPQYILIDEEGEQNLFSGYEISLAGLPEEAVFDPSTRVLAWEPTVDQIGTYDNVIISTSSGGNNRACYFNITLDVSYPSMKLPFNPSGISIGDESSGLLVAWTSHEDDYSYHDTERDKFCPEHNKGCLSALVIVRLDDQPKLLATKYFAFGIEHIFATSDRLVIATHWERQTTSQVFHVFASQPNVELLSTFTVNKESYPSSAYMSIETKSFRIKDASTKKSKVVDLYSFEVVERDLLHVSNIASTTKPDGTSFSVSYTAPVREGIVENGILYDPKSGEPSVLIDRGPFSFPSDRYYSSYSYMPQWLSEIKPYTNKNEGRMVCLHDNDICLQSQVLDAYKDDHGNRKKKVVIHVLDLKGNFLGTKTVLERVTGNNEWGNEYLASVLTTSGNHIFLAHLGVVYSLKSSDFAATEDSSKESIGNNDLHFTPKQTTFCIQGSNDVELYHTVLGGKPPYTYFDTTEDTGLELDTTTGTATLNGSEFFVKATEALVKEFAPMDQYEPKLLAASRKASDPIMHIENCLNPSELPVSREISLQVLDQNGETASITYYIFVGVPYEDIAPLVAEWKQNAPTTPPPSPTVVFAPAPFDSLNLTNNTISPTSDGLDLANNVSSLSEDVDEGVVGTDKNASYSGETNATEDTMAELNGTLSASDAESQGYAVICSKLVLILKAVAFMLL